MSTRVWGRRIRRWTAAAAAAVTAWAALRSSILPMASHVQSGAFAAAVLRTELGPGSSSLDPWYRLAAGQLPGLPRPSPLPTPAPSREQPSGPGGPEPGDEEPPGITVEPEQVVEKTLLPQSGSGYVTGAGLVLHNRTSLEVDLAGALAQPLEFKLSPASEGPQILILHTHTTEAYTPQGEDIYTPSDENTRTLDEGYNMLRVGDEMARAFTEMGFHVIHDRGVYDYPHYAGAYDRSRAAAKAYLEQYPTIAVVLDVHRDALTGSDGTVYKVCAEIDGVKTAQIELVVGSCGGGGDHPNWQQNLALAAKVQRGMNALYPTLARPMALRSSVYDQDLSPGWLLVEVGSHGNSLPEALAGARDFARATGAVLLPLIEGGV